MRALLKARWFVLAAWIAIVAVLVMTAPNMTDLVREKGQLSIPEGYPSSDAQEILSKVNKQEAKEGELQTALVFHNPDKLTEADQAEIERAINLLDKKKADLGILSINSHVTEKELEDQLVATDGKTIMAAVTLERGDREAQEMSAALYDALDGVKVDHYFTGSWMIDEDVIISSQEGLKKTEYITVIFILIVLFIVFKSAVAPFVPLLTVGLSFIASQSIVAFLVDWFDFPLSTFTQIFLVAVLFGIGTDYGILLLSRFKEELAANEDVFEAIIITYKNAGRTVIFSGLSVLIGFSAVGFSTFKLYQSAAAVAIGIVVLLIALFTFVPFSMAVLGRKMFWPAKGSLEHKESKIWGAAGKFALARPLLALLITAGVIAPFLITYDGDLSFNSLDEIGDGYDSVKAFNIISDSFGPGESLPAKIVLEHDEKLDTSEYLALIEKISREIDKVDHVEKVRSATRPIGDEIEDLLVKNQVEALDEGIGEGNEGLRKISDGLKEASTSLTDSAPQLKQATDGIGSLIDGTNELKHGVSQLQTGLAQIETGIRSGSMGAGEINGGLQKMKENAAKLATGSKELLTSYEQIGQGLSKLNDEYAKIQGAIAEEIASSKSSLEKLAAAHPEIQADPNFQAAMKSLATAEVYTAGLPKLNDELAKIAGGISQANAGFSEVAEGQAAIVGGFDQLIAGIGELEQGLAKAADGQGQIIGKIPEVTGGISQLNEGQQQLYNGFKDLDGQMGQLTDGLTQSVDGLNQVVDGLGSARDYLQELSSSTGDLSGWFIPTDVLASDDFKQVFDTYMSKDRKVTTIDVVFEENPYSSKALDKIDEIKAAVERATADTKLEDAKFGVSGVSSIYHDLRTVSDADYNKTVMIMLVGITIILFVLLRSFVMPMYLLASLILTYYTSMAVAEAIFVNLLGYTGINWAVPFFAFVMLVALGIDYSIFLMDRFNEYKTISIQEAILEAMKKMGTVIISAVVILGGTFAAMLPSGVLSLLQIATIVLTGLVLYAFLFLPLFVPVMVKTFGIANWWPFKREKY